MPCLSSEPRRYSAAARSPAAPKLAARWRSPVTYGHGRQRGKRDLVASEHAPGLPQKADQKITLHVWGYDGEVGESVVDVDVSYLRRRLETFGPNMIDTVRGASYRLHDNAP